jgi:low temperature requirement protein LtrA
VDAVGDPHRRGDRPLRRGVRRDGERAHEVAFARIAAPQPITDKRVEPLELFFDLVFVFALTQVTARMADDLSWGGLLRGLLVLAAIWWAWAAYAWLTNEVDGSRDGVRLAIVGAMVAMLIASLAIPGAFEDDALLFAVAYLGVRWMHIALFAAGSDSVDVRQAARALAPVGTLAPALLLVASAFDGAAQIAVWIAALLFDYVGGALRGIEGWRLSPGHFAERHGLIVIIALGESIVAIGVGAAGIELHAGELAAATLGVVVSASLWWVYFDAALGRVEERLHALHGRARNVTARDGFSFLHLPLIAGIVLLALGVKKTLEHVDEPLADVAAVALCGGVAL